MKFLTHKVVEKNLQNVPYLKLRKVLFVCLGNICRSPIAEAVFTYLVKKRKLEEAWSCDSAALGRWHEGKPPDYRARKVLCKHKIRYYGVSRVICRNDYKEFDFILGMDLNNISLLRDEKGNSKNCKAQIMLLGEFDPNGEKIIEDPYYDQGIEGFEKCFQQCFRSCEGFLDKYSLRTYK
ncbi:low molecular weight phosphotyrosine protein phosphatase-like [Onthophagus taurus]|uniref:low molecular weight phosphotyrosine protein phosphatase-like n=1 Tax=Onthophagus taurus TaxID=166361 RepID=UPI000C209B55|nr:low molecular weight phosphotyrosine protein phosphatase-like isoform X1 [Onthophagus taurus]